jgi:hypothetical protein
MSGGDVFVVFSAIIVSIMAFGMTASCVKVFSTAQVCFLFWPVADCQRSAIMLFPCRFWGFGLCVTGLGCLSGSLPICHRFAITSFPRRFWRFGLWCNSTVICMGCNKLTLSWP